MRSSYLGEAVLSKTDRVLALEHKGVGQGVLWCDAVSQPVASHFTQCTSARAHGAGTDCNLGESDVEILLGHELLGVELR